MKFKAREVSEVISYCGILGTFEVEVRFLTRAQVDALFTRCSKRVFNTQSGQAERVVDEEKWAKEAPLAYIAGWRGLTPSIVRQLGVDLDEEPPVDAEGFVKYDDEAAASLWRLAQADKFSQQIINWSRDLLALNEEAKKLAKKGSSVSPES